MSSYVRAGRQNDDENNPDESPEMALQDQFVEGTDDPKIIEVEHGGGIREFSHYVDDSEGKNYEKNRFFE